MNNADNALMARSHSAGHDSLAPLVIELADALEHYRTKPTGLGHDSGCPAVDPRVDGLKCGCSLWAARNSLAKLEAYLNGGKSEEGR